MVFTSLQNPVDYIFDPNFDYPFTNRDYSAEIQAFNNLGGNEHIYLEVAPLNWYSQVSNNPQDSQGDPIATWCSTSRNVPSWLNTWPNATSTPMPASDVTTSIYAGYGYVNTSKMMASCAFGAANLANSYRGGGFSDWYLPSLDEYWMLSFTLAGRNTSFFGPATGEYTPAQIQSFSDFALSSSNYWTSSEGFPQGVEKNSQPFSAGSNRALMVSSPGFSYSPEPFYFYKDNSAKVRPIRLFRR